MSLAAFLALDLAFSHSAPPSLDRRLWVLSSPPPMYLDTRSSWRAGT